MKTQLFILAGVISVISSVSCAQNILVVTSSSASFGHDWSFAWSQESNPHRIVDPFLANEVQSQIKAQLENVGLSPRVDEFQVPNVIVVATEMGPKPNPGTLVIELYDASTKALLWRAIAQNALNEGEWQDNKQIVDRAITKMFKNFPYH